MMMCHDSKMYKCLCCGYVTLAEQAPGTFEICPVCGWEDDNLQAENPTLSGGANEVSLEEAQRNFFRLGAVTREAMKHVRGPRPDEVPR